jgi:hypothetical protein
MKDVHPVSEVHTPAPTSTGLSRSPWTTTDVTTASTSGLCRRMCASRPLTRRWSSSPRAPNVRHATGRTDRAGSESVFEKSTRHALEVVPPLERLHPDNHGVKIDQGTIADGTT